MVFIPHHWEIPRLNAYLTTKLEDSELQSLKRSFELGTCAPFNTRLELVIKHAPEGYIGKPFSYVRRKETEAGRSGPFVVIDEWSAKQGAVWYIENFATEEEVEDGEAESTNVVWRIPLKIECLSIAFVNYDIANMSIQEDLDALGVEFPVSEDYTVEEASDSGGWNVDDDRRSQDAYAVALPGEFEESTDMELRKKWLPMPEKVIRLKPGLAEEVGLVNAWSLDQRGLAEQLKKRGIIDFPEGSTGIQLRYNPEFDWPKYEWPEDSL
ncbi:hypothetical protein F5Y16DRAFT_386613 [Xylariaceae sp. FL0255]|nr:hypothetical protein F5Y16DRAFT_386613 [Xylariaceae sp. FL0255]